ncbi:PAS domain S-box-containing protein/diguanylate cyclase (GGDEF) domain-containing protein [Vibrio xiamenensis]|uniref:diguanylate cyclase n=1 Tax=Vibrio xiamenensis TaxID=861298 RepID=A0A1G7YS52_9VIBR|nr:diguanylate cyclase [Vibrio xiamenensis]SDG99363.1 PAS domain S-box-containing protein/diguanylate cyclase (GGDEF) domain-containing protein [Vibrio xiamenensis]
MLKTSYTSIKEFLLVFLVLAILPSLYFFKTEQEISRQVRQTVEQKKLNQIEFSQHALDATYRKVAHAFPQIAHNGFVHRALQQQNAENIQMVEDLWLLTARGQDVYSSLRLIDAQGNELVGINHHNGYSIVVAKTRLQNTQNLSYFKQAQQLKAGEISTQNVDFEYNYRDEIVPIVRVITPIDFMNQRKGYVMVNLNFSAIFKNMMFSHHNKSFPEVVDENGYYVMSDNNQQLLGHLIPENSQYTIASTLPDLWRQMHHKVSGVIEDNQAWYLFKRVELTAFKPYMTLYLFDSVDAKELAPLIDKEVSELHIQMTGVYTLIAMISLGFVIWHAQHDKNSLDSRIARATMNGISAVIITDRANRIVFVNDEFTRLSGYKLKEVKGKRPYLFSASKYPQELYINIWKRLAARGLWQGEVVNKKKDGSLLTEIMRIQTVTDSNDVVQFYVSSFVDISERKALELRLRELSEKDSLCNLWNRRKFDIQLDDYCKRVGRYGEQEPICLALLDVDNFKLVNDQFGHDEGDKTLLYIAQMLAKHSRKTDFVARIGGEEFALLMPHTDIQQALQVVERIRCVIEDNYVRETTVSIGVTQVCLSSAHSYKRADKALYHSKQNGRNQVHSIENGPSITVEGNNALRA